MKQSYSITSRRNGIRLLLAISCFVLTLFTIFIAADPAGSQTVDSSWSPPDQLSDSNNKAGTAVMASDMYGNVHIIWVEQLPDNSSAIQYTLFNGKEWSDVVSLHQTATGGRIESISTDVSPQGELYLSWNEGNRGPVLLIHAPAHDTLVHDRWSEPVAIQAAAAKQKIRVDSQGVVHLLYLDAHGDNPGIYYVNDHPGDQNSRVKIDPAVPQNFRPVDLDFEMDAKDGLHAIWYYADQSAEAFPGRWIMYANKLDSRAGWNPAVTIDEDINQDGKLRLPAPDFAVENNQVYIVYAGDQTTHRFFTYSNDRGITWTPPQQVFGDLHGQAQGDGLAIDASGRLHFFGQVRYPQGLYHAMLDSSMQWSEPTLVYLIANTSQEPIGDRIHAHGVRLAIQAGNQLVATFYNRDDREHFPLYAMVHRLDINPAPLQATPIIKTAAGSPENPTLAAASIAGDGQSSSTQQNPQDVVQSSPDITILAGVGLVALLLIAALIIWFARQRSVDHS